MSQTFLKLDFSGCYRLSFIAYSMVLKAMVFIHTISLSFHGLLTPYLAVKEPVFFVSGSNKTIFKNKDEI
jgi:hypothetical protein